MFEARSAGNEAAAIGSMRSLRTAQRAFLKTSGGRYGGLNQLERAGLIDAVLASGTKQGYKFTVSIKTAKGSSAWSALASPVVEGNTGDRHYFVQSSDSAIHFEMKQPANGSSPAMGE